MARDSSRPIGGHIRRVIIARCPECDTDADLKPGPLNEDRTIEYRKCEVGHTVEFPPTLWSGPGDATETGIF